MTWGPTNQQQGYAAGPPSAAGYQPAPVAGNATPRPMMRGWVITGLAVIGFGLGGPRAGRLLRDDARRGHHPARDRARGPPAGRSSSPRSSGSTGSRPSRPRYLVAAFLWGALVAALLAGLFNTGATSLLQLPRTGRAGQAGHGRVLRPGGRGGRQGPAGPARLVAPAARVRRDHRRHGLRRHRAPPASRSPRTSSTSAWPTPRAATQALTGTSSSPACLFTPVRPPDVHRLTGIGIGIAATTRSRVLKVVAPVAGYLLAVLLHAIWNLAAVTRRPGPHRRLPPRGGADLRRLRRPGRVGPAPRGPPDRPLPHARTPTRAGSAAERGAHALDA